MASVSRGNVLPGNAGFGGKLECPRPIPCCWNGLFLGPNSIGSAGIIGAGVLRAGATCGGLGGRDEAGDEDDGRFVAAGDIADGGGLGGVGVVLTIAEKF